MKVGRHRDDEKRFNVAYLKINLGFSLKDIADRLHMNPHTVEFYWRTARQQITAR
jgi:DNA-binding CsgD family transcriptional regulator